MLQPEEYQESAKEVLERAAAKGLLGPKPKVHTKTRENNETGDADENKETEKSDKLLHRRVRKPQSRLSPSRKSAHLTATAKVQTHNLNYKAPSVGTILTARRSPPRHVPPQSVISRLYSGKPKAQPSSAKQKNHIQEYRKVVKHPAPFR